MARRTTFPLLDFPRFLDGQNCREIPLSGLDNVGYHSIEHFFPLTGCCFDVDNTTDFDSGANGGIVAAGTAVS